MLFGTIAVLYFGREILLPLAFALILTFVLSPVVGFLQKARLGRVPSVVLAVLATVLLGGWIAWIIAAQLVNVAQEVPRYRQNIRTKMEALRIPTQGPLGVAVKSLKEIAGELAKPDPAPKLDTPKPPVPVQIIDAPENRLDYFRELAGPVLRRVTMSGMVLIFTIFMLVQRIDLRHRLLRLVGMGQINLVTQALDDAAQRVSRYLLMQLMVNAGFGLLFGVGLYFIGVPNAALWGALAGLFRIVPYIGTLFAAALPIALSLAAFNTWLPPLLVFLLFAGLELAVANFFEPWLYGTHVGLSSLAVLVAAVFWSALWGPAGLILSTPLTVCVVVLGRYVPQLAFLNILLGDEEVLAPEAQVYQHLLSMDQAEVRVVVDKCLKDKPLVQLYDSVLIPALSLAEQDRHKGEIDVQREEFLFVSMSEMIAELSETVAVANRVGPTERFNAQVLCLPAGDQADELTAAMLAQLLEQAGQSAMSLSLTHSAREEVLSFFEKRRVQLVCVCALPPYAFPPARNVCELVRDRFPNVKVVVGVWGFDGDVARAKSRFGRSQPDELFTSVAQAVEQIPALVGSSLPSPA